MYIGLQTLYAYIFGILHCNLANGIYAATVIFMLWMCMAACM